MNNISETQPDSTIQGNRQIAGVALRATLLGVGNIFSTSLAANTWIYDLPGQELAIALAGLSNIAAFVNAAPEFIRLSIPREGDSFTTNLTRALLALTPFVGTFAGAWTAVSISPESPVYPPPTPPITPEWMVPNLDQRVMYTLPKITEALTGLQNLAGRVLASM